MEENFHPWLGPVWKSFNTHNQEKGCQLMALKEGKVRKTRMKSTVPAKKKKKRKKNANSHTAWMAIENTKGKPMGTVRITSLSQKFNGSHFGLPPGSIHRMTGWVAISRILWRMRTAPICSPLFCTTRTRQSTVENGGTSTMHQTS